MKKEIRASLVHRQLVCLSIRNWFVGFIWVIWLSWEYWEPGESTLPSTSQYLVLRRSFVRELDSCNTGQKYWDNMLYLSQTLSLSREFLARIVPSLPWRSKLALRTFPCVDCWQCHEYTTIVWRWRQAIHQSEYFCYKQIPVGDLSGKHFTSKHFRLPIQLLKLFSSQTRSSAVTGSPFLSLATTMLPSLQSKTIKTITNLVDQGQIPTATRFES